MGSKLLKVNLILLTLVVATAGSCSAATMSGNTAAVDISYGFGGAPVIANNIIVTATDTSGIHAFDAASPVLSHNLLSGGDSQAYYVGSGLTPDAASNDIAGEDPLLTSGYHIQYGSPCIDAGDDSRTSTGEADMDGEARICGSHVDVGADEYTPLTVTVNKADGQADPTNVGTVSFTVEFSEPVEEFTASDVSVTGGAVSADPTAVDSRTYTVQVTAQTAAEVTAALPAGVVQSAVSGVTNDSSTSTDNTVVFDNVPPTIGNTSVSPTYSTGPFTGCLHRIRHRW